MGEVDMKNFPDRRPRLTAWRDVELGARMGGGARNPVFRASRRGADLVVRVSGRSEASLAWELDLLEHLAAHGLTVPTTLETEDGRRHDEGVLVQRLIPGNAPRDRTDWNRVVQTLEQVHGVTGQWPQRPGFASARTLLTERRGGDVDFNAMPRPDNRRPRLGDGNMLGQGTGVCSTLPGGSAGQVR